MPDPRPLTVAALIKILQKQNPKARVMVKDTNFDENGLILPAYEVTAGFYDSQRICDDFALKPTETLKTPAVLID